MSERLDSVANRTDSSGQVAVSTSTKEPLVSVVMPAYNAGRHIAESIASVEAQTLTDWELCVTDDCSTDDTADIIHLMSADDLRIRYAKQPKNQGAAAARNASLQRARGRYIAFLDADDIWYPDKLEKQVSFMQRERIGFSCASFEIIDEQDNRMGRTVILPSKLDWWGYLTNNYLQTPGIMADLTIIDRSLLHMPPAEREDAATWIQVLGAGFPCYCMPDVLWGLRRTAGSLSSNHLEAAKGTWKFYRTEVGLPLPKALYCFARYAALAVWKRTYPEGKVPR